MRNKHLKFFIAVQLVLLFLAFEREGWGQASGGSNVGPANSSTQVDASNTDNVNPGNIEDLLNLAEKDLGQLSQIHTSGQTGSASLDMTVSSVARQESTVGKSPTAIFVITNEMIRRSGALTIPDVLRMAPGIQVAQISSDEWAVSARGFNNLFANKLLVQIDGRTVYDLFFGGVSWDAQDVMLEDVERIEVIRGPGATIWGSNAVNGVINIITKRAKDTQGLLVQGGAGSHERGYTNARAGGQIGEDIHYRVYGKWFDRGPSYLPDGSTVPDEWHQGRTGFRMDCDASLSDAMTLQGDYYDGKITTIEAPTIPVDPFFLPTDAGHISGKNILYRWKHTMDDDADWTFQAYYDRTERQYVNPVYGPDRDLVDLDYQQRFPIGARNEIIWGCGYRFTQDTFIDAPFYMNLIPPKRFDNYFSYFLQDQITLVQDRLYFIAGSKFEHNDYTNFEYQPTGRLLWTPDERHSIWGAVSRAVHVPTRQNDDILIRLRPVGFVPPFPPFVDPLPIFPVVSGNRNMKSEELLAWELGIREQMTERFSWDLAMFYNQYSNLSALLSGMPQFDPPAYFIAPGTYVNGGAGETYGAEIAANYEVNERWRMQLAYTYLRLFIHVDPGLMPDLNTADSPVNQVYFQSSWDIGNHWQLDMIGRYVDVLSGSGVPNYIVMDTRLAWLARKNLEVAVVGRNLLNGYYPEFSTASLSGVGVTEVGPQVYGQITWRY